ncbi:MAG: hypothetical protein M3Z98_02145 [Candidatus Dormibacteraeota bacterium]|nr:hypothetical protein [Candidatus Dormibacteraeota bacterium]
MLLHAQEEAEKANHSYIGTEHLLLGLLREPEGLAARVLTSLGIGIDAVRTRIEDVLGRSSPHKLVQIIPTSRVKRAIELAFDEAQKMRDDFVGTEHLLLGVLAEGEGVAAHVLTDLGAGEATARAEIERVRGRSEVESQSARVDRIFEVRARVLVHDRNPPHRLWEGRVTGHEGDRFQVEIDDHPGGRVFLVEPELMHPIPLYGALTCQLCQPI